MTPRLFIDLPLHVGESLTLAGDQHHYLKNVLRLQAGDCLTLFNGQGGEFRALVEAVKKKHIDLQLLEKQLGLALSPLSIHLAQGVSLGDKMDYVIQKATELGVMRITPLVTRQMKKIKTERLGQKQAHWQRVAISASEQCGRCEVPTVAAPVSFERWAVEQTGLRVICSPEARAGLSELTLNETVTLCIGPESGFHGEEISFAMKHGFQSVLLGPRVLRTETAPVVALSLLQALAGDLS